MTMDNSTQRDDRHFDPIPICPTQRKLEARLKDAVKAAAVTAAAGNLSSFVKYILPRISREDK
jgi:hypothetical protein